VGDPTLWKRALKQAVWLTAAIVGLAAVAHQSGPWIARVLTGTPDPLSAVCEALGVTVERTNVVGWAEVDRRSAWAPADLAAVARGAMIALAGEPAAGLAVETTARSGSWDAGVTELIVSEGPWSYRTSCRTVGEEARGKVYLVCEVDLAGPDVTGLDVLRKRVERSLHTLGRSSRQREPVFVTVFGYMAEPLSTSAAEERARAASARLRGSVVDVISGEGYVSALIHATMLGQAVSVGGTAVNLGLVFRPDGQTGRTRAVIGTPLYAGDL